MKKLFLIALLLSASVRADEYDNLANDYGMDRQDVLDIVDQLENLPSYNDGVPQGYYQQGSTYRAPADQPAPNYYPPGSTYRAAPRPLR